MRVERSLDTLPTTSVAEFRTEARWLHVHNRPVSVALGIYLTWAALGFTVGVLAFGLAGLAVTPESWWIVLAGAVLTALVVWRIVRVFRRAAHVREQVVVRSREIDERAARGEIPVVPPGWDRPFPASVSE